MSRGYGHVQRFVLSELDEQCAIDARWLHAHTLAGRLDGCDPTEASVKSVRRALRLLEKDGHVEVAASGTATLEVADRSSGGTLRGRLVARIPPSLSSQAATRRGRRGLVAAHRARVIQRPLPTSANRAYTLTLTRTDAVSEPRFSLHG